MTHANAPLSLEGRRQLVARCQTRPIAHVAAEMGISPAFASKRVNRCVGTAMPDCSTNMLPSGSYLVLSHFYNPGSESPELAGLAARLEETFLHSPMGTGRFRTRDEIVRYFGDLELVEPGVVTLNDWWPDGPNVKLRDPVQNLMIGAVARKP